MTYLVNSPDTFYLKNTNSYIQEAGKQNPVMCISVFWLVKRLAQINKPQKSSSLISCQSISINQLKMTMKGTQKPYG